MFPLFYPDAARTARAPKGRPLLTLPGLDFDRYPEIIDPSELAAFGEMEGLFQMPFPMGMPYLDFVVVDMNGIPSGRASFQLPNGNEYLYLETVFVNWPRMGAGAYPDTAPSGGESPMPKIQISSSDPNRRNARQAMQGPDMFWKSLPLNHISGQSIFQRGGNGFNPRRGFVFSPRDVVSIKVDKLENTDPRWVSVGISGRMITEKFLQGYINEKR